MLSEEEKTKCFEKALVILQGEKVPEEIIESLKKQASTLIQEVYASIKFKKGCNPSDLMVSGILIRFESQFENLWTDEDDPDNENETGEKENLISLLKGLLDLQKEIQLEKFKPMVLPLRDQSFIGGGLFFTIDKEVWEEEETPKGVDRMFFCQNLEWILWILGKIHLLVEENWVNAKQFDFYNLLADCAENFVDGGIFNKSLWREFYLEILKKVQFRVDERVKNLD